MALNKKDLQEAKKLVEQINAEYKKMGKGIKFPMPDSNSTLQDFTVVSSVKPVSQIVLCRSAIA